MARIGADQPGLLAAGGGWRCFAVVRHRRRRPVKVGLLRVDYAEPIVRCNRMTGSDVPGRIRGPLRRSRVWDDESTSERQRWPIAGAWDDSSRLPRGSLLD